MTQESKYITDLRDELVFLRLAQALSASKNANQTLQN